MEERIRKLEVASAEHLSQMTAFAAGVILVLHRILRLLEANGALTRQDVLTDLQSWHALSTPAEHQKPEMQLVGALILFLQAELALMPKPPERSER